MKKNRMMRLASVMLIAVLMTTCTISGTFAKYVSSAEASATARVAKWGVEFVTHSDDLFKPQYRYNTTPTGVNAEFSVEADVDVVAPGTFGTGYSFTTAYPVGGKPEVSYEVTFDAAEGFKTIYADTYYPILYTLELGANTVTTKDMGELMSELESWRYMYDVDKNVYYISNDGGANWTNVGSAIPTLELSWVWEFHTDAPTDVLDTKLGQLAAGYDKVQVGVADYNLEIAFTIVATAAQID